MVSIGMIVVKGALVERGIAGDRFNPAASAGAVAAVVGNVAGEGASVKRRGAMIVENPAAVTGIPVRDGQRRQDNARAIVDVKNARLFHSR